MLLSKMYCSEQIVIPEKVSNLLKTYAKAALKTQPYDLLRWSAAYFRCLSEDEMPPVKPRYEHENVFGCLTRGYLKVLMNQVGNGYFVRRDILEHRWSGLCLPEDELLKFLSITRMLYWPQLHWLKLISVMVGSLNQSFEETMSMLCELLTDEPEGFSAPVPLWIFRECFKFLAELDCSKTQTFFDGRKVISEGKLENEYKIASLPRKLSSISYQNAVLEYWQQRIENNIEKESTHDDISHESIAKSPDESKSMLRPTSAITRDGSDFNILGDLRDPHEIIKRSLDFEGILSTIQQMKIDDDDRNQRIEELSDEQRNKITRNFDKIAELREKLSNNLTTSSTTDVNNAKSSFENEFYQLLRDIGPPWNWLHRFVNQTCHDKSFNFIEAESNNEIYDDMSSDIQQLNNELRVTTATSSTLFDEEKSTVTLSEASGVCISLQNVDNDAATSDVDNIRAHHHRLLVETICSISEASDNGACDIRDTSSISCFLDEQHSDKLIKSTDYCRLKKFIDKAQERGLAFNDLNELYNYFVQESSREHATMAKEAARDNGDFDVDEGNLTAAIDEMQTDDDIDVKKNVVAIFGESGIEVDGKLLEAKVSERMILGLVDKGSDDNFSDIASSISSVSHAETVRMKQNNNNSHITRERNTQTASYREQIHSRRLQSKHALTRKTKSASSIKRQPFVCKIPPLPGIGEALDSDKLDRLLRFLTHRSFQQGGFVYPRNLHEDEFQQIIRD